MNATAAGLSLIDSALGLFVIAAVAAATAQTLAAAGTVVAAAERRAALVDVAREAAERLRDAPCGPDPACPAGYRCSIARSAAESGVIAVDFEFTAAGTGRSMHWQTAVDASACG